MGITEADEFDGNGKMMAVPVEEEGPGIKHMPPEMLLRMPGVITAAEGFSLVLVEVGNFKLHGKISLEKKVPLHYH